MSEKRAKQKRFNQIIDDIKNLKIQGANNIAKAALQAYIMYPNAKTVKKLLLLRPTEPLMINVLRKIKHESYDDILFQLNNSQKKINENVFKTIKNGEIIFTHCHSTSVIESLIYAKKRKKKFKVYLTETRPLFQGRKTAKDLSRNGIETEMFVDSSAMIVFSGNQGVKRPTKIFIGADALTKQGAINKVGSGMFAKVSHEYKIPLYVISNSWKFTNKKLAIEQRSSKEIWKNSPKKIQIKNFAFEEIDKKYITKIVSELGILSYEEFLKKVN